MLSMATPSAYVEDAECLEYPGGKSSPILHLRLVILAQALLLDTHGRYLERLSRRRVAIERRFTVGLLFSDKLELHQHRPVVGNIKCRLVIADFVLNTMYAG